MRAVLGIAAGVAEAAIAADAPDDVKTKRLKAAKMYHAAAEDDHVEEWWTFKACCEAVGLEPTKGEIENVRRALLRVQGAGWDYKQEDWIQNFLHPTTTRGATEGGGGGGGGEGYDENEDAAAAADDDDNVQRKVTRAAHAYLAAIDADKLTYVEVASLFELDVVAPQPGYVASHVQAVARKVRQLETEEKERYRIIGANGG